MKIYSLDYLSNEELTEDDLHNLFDKKSLIYSILVGMFNNYTNYNYTNDEIIKIVKSDNWYKKHYWTKNNKNNFYKKLIKVYKNVFVFSDYMSEIYTQNFLIKYSLNIK